MFSEILSIAGPIFGGAIGADAAEDAANIQSGATREGIAEQRRQFDLSRADLEPWRTAGGSAITRLSQLMGLGGGRGGRPGTVGSMVQGGGIRSIEDIARELEASGRFGATMATDPSQTFVQPLDRSALMAEAQRIYDSQPGVSEQSQVPQEITGSGLTADVRDELARSMGYMGEQGTGEFMKWLQADPQRAARWDQLVGQAKTSKNPATGEAITGSGLTSDVRNQLARTMGYTGGFGTGEFQQWLQADPQRAADWEERSRQSLAQGGDYQLGGTDPLMRRFTVADFYSDPVTQLGFKFGLDEGMKGVRRSAPGMTNSGAMIKALTRYATDYTGQKAAESQGRFTGDQTNIYNRLAGVAGTGQTAATTGAQLGAGTASTIGNLVTAGGNANAASRIAGANAISGGIAGAWNNWNQRNMLDRILSTGNNWNGASWPAQSWGY